MQYRLFLGLVLAASLTPVLSAGELSLGPDANPTGVSILSEEPNAAGGYRISLEARVGRLNATTRQTSAGEFTALEIPGFQQTATVGAPSLPVMNRILEIPAGGTVSVQVASRSRRTIDLAAEGYAAPVFPRQPPQVKLPEGTPFEWNQRTYLAGGFQQDPLAQVVELGNLRDMRLVMLKLAPVAYDPVKGILEVHDEIRIDVRVRGADLEATRATKAKYFSPYFASVRGAFLTPKSIGELDPKRVGTRTYAVVADAALVPTLEPFLAWKREQGFDVILSTTAEVGVTNEALKGYVHGLYENPADGHGAPDFLLLVGDHDNVPAVQKSGHVSDLDYVTCTSGDYLPDILTGRLSAQTPDELAPQVAKLLEYQRYEMTDPSFLSRVTLTAGWDYSHATEWGWPQIKYGMENYFNAGNGFETVSSFLSEGAHQNEDAIIATINAGVAFYNYTAHGSKTSFADPNFTIADVESLTNEGQYPLILANCCVTGSFDLGKCFGESWLRAPGKGAIGFIGGSNNTYWDEDLWFGNGFYEIAHPNDTGAAPARSDTGLGAYDHQFNAAHATAGSLIVTGNMAVEASNTSRKLYYWEVYHLFGDPSLQMYWGVPKENPVDHSESAGSDGLRVYAAPGSYVGVTQGGVLLASGFVGSEGVTTFELDGRISGDAKVVVTAKGYKPYRGTVAVGG